MLEAFKGRWQSVQQDVSVGIQKLKHKSPSIHSRLSVSVSSGSSDTPTTSGLSPGAIAQSALNLDAGAEILNRNQIIWQETRKFSEENVRSAEWAGRELGKLEAKCRNTAAGLMYLKKEVGTLVTLADDLSTLVAETAKLQGLCEEVESSLAYLEVICDTQEFQEKRLDANFNFSLHRESKIAEFNEAKAEMAIQYMHELETREKKRAVEQSEKQQLYQQAFETDLQLYKTTGLIANTLPPLEIGSRQQEKNLHTVSTDLSHSKLAKTAGNISDSNTKSRVSPTVMLRELIEISHRKNQIAKRDGSEADLNFPPVLSGPATKELADLLAASQLHAPTDLTPAKVLRERQEEILSEENEEIGKINEPAEEENFLAGDVELLEEFLSDVRLEDSGIAGSDSQSVTGDSDPQEANSAISGSG